MNNLITRTEIEAMIKNLSKNKSPGPDGFTGEFQQSFREDIMPIILKLFQKVSQEGTLPNSFYEASITLIPKADKDNTQKGKYRPISLIDIDAKKKKKVMLLFSFNYRFLFFIFTFFFLSVFNFLFDFWVLGPLSLSLSLSPSEKTIYCKHNVFLEVYRLSSFLFLLFSISCSVAVISIILSSMPLIHSFASVIPLLILSNVLFIFVCVFLVLLGLL